MENNFTGGSVVEKSQENCRSIQDMRYRAHYTLHGPFFSSTTSFLFLDAPSYACT